MPGTATVFTADAIVSGGQVLRPGWIVVDDDRVVEAGAGDPPRPADIELGAVTVVPGFVDMHVHGGGGTSYTAGDIADVHAAAAFHRAHGTTSTLASLVAAHPAELLTAVAGLRRAADAGDIVGIHLEGPWLSAHRCGAHDPTALRAPESSEIAAVLRAGGDAIAMVTLAPELPGGVAAIEQFVDAGVVVAVGHTEATYEQTRQAIARGARVGTHLFNAMRSLHHREPGPALALLEDHRVTVELVGDGVHVHPSLVEYVTETAGPSRVALVTDAMAAAGMTDGAYRLGVLDVEVVDSVARVASTGAIAGSTATMDLLFRRALRTDGLADDDALCAAVAMTSTTPARTLGRDDIGDLTPGRRADFVVVGADALVEQVYRRGRQVDPEPFGEVVDPSQQGVPRVRDEDLRLVDDPL